MKKITFRPLARRIVSFVLAASAAVLCCSASASADTGKTPSGIAFSDLEKEITELQEGKNYASFAASVFCGDDILYTGCFGYANKEDSILADEETAYEWGSISKTMIWVSAMQLYEQGKLDLNEDVRNYLPEGFFRKLKYDDPITMIDLMNHQGGWQEALYTIQVYDEDEIVPLAEALQYSEPPQVFRPGEVEAYSNWGAALAAYVVECVSGTDYGEYVHENILEPLGMEHTAVMPDHRDNAWVREQREKLHSYMIFTDPDGTEVNEPLGVSMAYINLYPAGGVTGTIGDMAKYAQSFVSDNCPLFEKSETLDLLLSGTSFYGSSGIESYCHGFIMTPYAVNVKGHTGGTDACLTNLCFDPESKVGVVVMMNQTGDGVFCRSIPELVFGKKTDNPLSEPTEIAERNDIDGTYISTRGYFRGMMKVFGVVEINPIAKISEDKFSLAGLVDIDRIGSDLYSYSYGEQNGIFAQEATSDGRIVLTGISLIENKYAYAEVAMVIIYAAMILASVVLLIVKLIKKIRKKGTPYAGAWAVTAGQLTRVISLAAIYGFIETRSSGMCITHGQGAFFGIIQLLCFAVFIAAGVLSVLKLISKNEDKAKSVVYICDIIFNVYSAVFLLYFELFFFWL